MQLPALRALALGLPHTTFVKQWGECLVFKVAGKMFLIISLDGDLAEAVVFKCTPDEFDELTDIDGVTQAPYCAKRMWVRVGDLDALSSAELTRRIRRSYDLVFAGLPKKTRAALAPPPSASSVAADVSLNAQSPSLRRVILYVRDLPKVAAFYQKHFGLHPLPGASKDWLELGSASGGCSLALHQASRAQKSGAAMKLVFGVVDVAAFKDRAAASGLQFGPVHTVEGFVFANAKDPAGNALQISSRGLK